MKKNNLRVLIIILIISVFSANAQLKVASIVGNNMVLQRNSEVKIWGKTEPKKV